MKSVRAVFGAATTAALVLLLVACGSGAAQPNYSPVSTPAPSTTVPSRPVPNTTINVPPGAMEPVAPAMADDSDSAYEFAVYYWQMLSWAYSTNDASVLEGLFANSCETCVSFRTKIANGVENDGLVLVGGQIDVSEASVAFPGPTEVSADYAFDVVLDVHQLEVRSQAGDVLKTYPAMSETQRTYVSWTQDRLEVIYTTKVVVD